MKSTAVLWTMLWALAAAPAQDDVLAVERREDVRGRDVLAHVLAAANSATCSRCAGGTAPEIAATSRGPCA